MVNEAVTLGRNASAIIDPERTLALSYAPRAASAGVSALFALDATLGGILRTTREPMVGQMRLTWWYEALERLDTSPPPAEPVLQALANEVVTRGVSGTTLAGMIDAWEVLLDPETPDDATLEAYARRGVILFGAAGRVLGSVPSDPIAPAGRGWALVDLAAHVAEARVVEGARRLARTPLEAATAGRWSRNARALGGLAHLAALDLAEPAGSPIRRGSPARVWRLLRHRITGG